MSTTSDAFVPSNHRSSDVRRCQAIPLSIGRLAAAAARRCPCAVDGRLRSLAVAEGSAGAPSPGEQVATILGGISGAGSFSARRAASPDDLHLEVRGVGRLQFPVPDAQARLLRAVARPASYGQGEQTLLDPRVRDTWQIPISRVKIDKRQWNRTLQPVLARLGDDLGLPAGSVLRAELQSMLVYTPGQFFVPHQDSEKTDGMIASLVVTLPGSFTGGSLRVTHRGEMSEHRSSNCALSFVAFYADCRHEVRPVRTGNRIVLTYNLLLKSDASASASEPPAATVDAVADQLRAHFATPPRPRWSRDAARPPDRLVYLLDHEYTERGVSWARLKGVDAVRVAALRAAAAAAGCESTLALADVHETWSCLEDEWDGTRGRGWERPRDDDDEWDDTDDYDDASDQDEHELEELLDWSVTLTHFAGEAEPIASQAADIEVCSTTPSVQLEPFESAHEGYMGNYGNTVDRWYHRGAIVLWPREHAFAVHAQASPAWAVRSLTETMRAGEPAATREMAATLASFWAGTVRGDDQLRVVMTPALEVATALDEPDLAAIFLRPFRVEYLSSEQAPALLALLARYGERWVDTILADQLGQARQVWSQPVSDRHAWVASPSGLCQALQVADPVTGSIAARLLLRHAWAWLDGEFMRSIASGRPSGRLEALAGLAMPILGVLAGAAVVQADDVRDDALTVVCAEESDVLLACLVQVLRAASAAVPAQQRADAGLDRVTLHCRQRLRARLARPPRAVEDWSISSPGGCGCDRCGTLTTFLADPTRRQLEWPLAEAGRKHVHGIIDQAELPVGHRTRRSGRPYTLVLTKSTAIFDLEAQARRRDEADLAWLDAQLRTSVRTRN